MRPHFLRPNPFESLAKLLSPLFRSKTENGVAAHCPDKIEPKENSQRPPNLKLVVDNTRKP